MKINTEVQVEIDANELLVEFDAYESQDIRDWLADAVKAAIKDRITDMIADDEKLNETMTILAVGAVQQALKWTEKV